MSGSNESSNDSSKATRARTNHVLARVIDEGIQMDAVKGATIAWAYLMAHSVDPNTILRVLSSAAARRREGGRDNRLRT